MSSPATGLGPLGQITLTVPDVGEAAAFYRESLGVRQMPIPAPNLAFFDCGGVRLMLAPPEEGTGSGGVVLYFKVDDIEQAHATLGDRGVSFIDTPHLVAKLPDHELWMVFFRDPGGNMLALMSERR